MYKRAYGSVFLIPLLLLFGSVCVLGLEEGREFLETPAAELGFFPVLAYEGEPAYERIPAQGCAPVLRERVEVSGAENPEALDTEAAEILNAEVSGTPTAETVKPLTTGVPEPLSGLDIPDASDANTADEPGAEPYDSASAVSEGQVPGQTETVVTVVSEGQVPEQEETVITAVIGGVGNGTGKIAQEGAYPELTDKPGMAAEQTPVRVYELGEEDLANLQRIVEAEAGSEDEDGKLLVANVVLNRVDSELFPDTVTEVVFQESQFSPVSGGNFWKVRASDETILAVQRALDGENISQGALYFAARKYAKKSSMKWFDTHLEYLFSHGGHEFFR